MIIIILLLDTAFVNNNKNWTEYSDTYVQEYKTLSGYELVNGMTNDNEFARNQTCYRQIAVLLCIARKYKVTYVIVHKITIIV